MLKLGLCLEWVDLIMRTVRIVSYAIFINGSPTDSFYSERGLRQGNHFSPFLFLFCAKAFSALLKKTEKEGRIHSSMVAREAPSVSHLFFVDDSILFTRSTMPEAGEIKNIISQYEQASGQMINMEKTEITCSSNISSEKKQELSQCLGVKAVDKHTKYLGLPTLIGK